MALGALARVEWLWYLSLLVIAAGLVWGAIQAWRPDLGVPRHHDRLIFKVGLIARYTMELLLGKGESIGVQQTLVGRLLNYGDLVVTGTGGAREVFRRVHDPIGYRNHIQQTTDQTHETDTDRHTHTQIRQRHP